MESLFLLVAAHALCDFALQNEAMGRGKSRKRNPSGDEEPFFPPWYAWMSAHALIHGGAVALVTGSWALGALETGLHAWIDHMKCEDRIDFDQDQLLHLACKLGYVVLFV
jgi:hypothetical protein